MHTCSDPIQLIVLKHHFIKKKKQSLLKTNSLIKCTFAFG